MIDVATGSETGIEGLAWGGSGLATVGGAGGVLNTTSPLSAVTVDRALGQRGGITARLSVTLTYTTPIIV
jgi:hypothetical protein